MGDVMRGTAQEQPSDPLTGGGLVVSNDQAVDVLLACYVQQFVSRATNPDNGFDVRARYPVALQDGRCDMQRFRR